MWLCSGEEKAKKKSCKGREQKPKCSSVIAHLGLGHKCSEHALFVKINLEAQESVVYKVGTNRSSEEGLTPRGGRNRQTKNHRQALTQNVHPIQD